MDGAEARSRFASAPVGRLATVTPDGRPHVVPIAFALRGEVIHTAVDDKPKSGRPLQRLVNLDSDPRCAVLVDHYDHDWEQLWWVRADGRARIVGGADRATLAALEARYDPYRDHPPPGPFIEIAVSRWRWWSATDSSSVSGSRGGTR